MRSLRTTMLLGFGVLLTVVLTALGTLLYYQARATVIPLTKDLSQEILNARSAGLGHLFRGYQNDVQTLSRDGLIRSGDLQSIAKELLKRRFSLNRDYEMLFFADLEGRFVGSTGATGNVGDRSYWRAIMIDGRDRVISEPVVSRATGATVFVVASAVTSDRGRRVGLVAATVRLDTLSQVAGAIGIGERGFGWVMDQQGLLIAHPKDSLRLKLNLIESDKDGYQGLAEIGKTLARGESGIGKYRRPDGTVFVTIYTPIPNTPHWGLGVSMPESELMGRAYGLMSTIVWGLATILAAVLLLVFVISGRIAAPVHQLMEGVQVVAAGNLDHRVEIRTGDEIEALADAYNRMTGSLKEQIDSLARVTAEKARVDGELRAANRIQASMLPRIFPPFPEIDCLDLYATMEPAKEIGGDFYDFFLVDERRLCFCVGDVSGKGIPAALFMVIGMTILKNLTLQGQPLAQVFAQANNLLCSENHMFITTFMGILDTRSGELEYVSAGHNPPLISRQEGDFEFLPAPVNLFLGGMEDTAYRSARLTLAPGDLLFVYTDGLTEAMNSADELYGDQRMAAALNGLRGCEAHELVDGMRQAVAGFVGTAPAADDLTMLALGLTPGKADQP